MGAPPAGNGKYVGEIRVVDGTVWVWRGEVDGWTSKIEPDNRPAEPDLG